MNSYNNIIFKITFLFLIGFSSSWAAPYFIEKTKEQTHCSEEYLTISEDTGSEWIATCRGDKFRCKRRSFLDPDSVTCWKLDRSKNTLQDPRSNTVSRNEECIKEGNYRISKLSDKSSDTFSYECDGRAYTCLSFKRGETITWQCRIGEISGQNMTDTLLGIY